MTVDRSGGGRRSATTVRAVTFHSDGTMCP